MDRQKEETGGVRKGEEHKNEVSDEREMRTDKEKKKKSRAGVVMMTCTSSPLKFPRVTQT